MAVAVATGVDAPEAPDDALEAPSDAADVAEEAAAEDVACACGK